MTNKNCLSEEDLTLHYYGELSAMSEQMQHLTSCALCKNRLTELSRDLDQLPELISEPDFAAGTRMAARVSERLNRRRKHWIPALGASAVASFALLITITNWSPQPTLRQTASLQTAQVTTAPVATVVFDEEMPEIDFFEELELLQELDLLYQIEGV